MGQQTQEDDMADLFTPQQRQGGPAYQHKCLIGNWSEDQEAEEHVFKDYMKKKDTNTLKVTGAADKLAMSFAAVQRAQCEGKQVRMHRSDPNSRWPAASDCKGVCLHDQCQCNTDANLSQ